MRYDYRGNKVLDSEYSSALKKSAVIALAILLLPLSLLAAAIGIVIFSLSKTHGKALANEKKIEGKKEAQKDIEAQEDKESPPSPPSFSPPPSPRSISPVSSVESSESDEELALNPKIMVQLAGTFQSGLTLDEMVDLIKERGHEIECLDIQNAAIDLSALLERIPNIEVLNFKNCTFQEKDLSGFKTLASLNKLSISECDLTSEHLKTLNPHSLSNLTKLDLSKNNLDDEGISSLIESLSNHLKLLDLSENQITSIGTKKIGYSEKLPYLEDLYVSDNVLNDESIEHLTKGALVKLKNLSVGYPKDLTVIGVKCLLDWVKEVDNRVIDYNSINPFIEK